MLLVALRKESVDRNFDAVQIVVVIVKSLSARRAWIEIEPSSTRKLTNRMSLSARRAWIEIVFCGPQGSGKTSLSARRAWIEITRPSDSAVDSASRSPQGERG